MCIRDRAQLAQANVSIEIESANAKAAAARAQGEAAVITTTGNAEGEKIRAIGGANAEAEQLLGLARAKGFEAQREAIGPEQTALVAALREIAGGHVKITPDIVVGGESGILGGLGALAMRALAETGPGANGNGNGAGDGPGDERPTRAEALVVAEVEPETGLPDDVPPPPPPAV